MELKLCKIPTIGTQSENQTFPTGNISLGSPIALAVGCFTDTTLEKAKVFCDIKTTLAVGVWNNISNLLFIVYEKHPEMGLYLEQKVKECRNESRRSTQTIGVSKLIKEFGFKIKPIDSKEQELINLFNLKFGHFSWENHLA
ncbi:hypothetical protein [Helicobacter pylori]|uniref:hypothetical protein n=1 Tax=Helicobacter pylori TaxID=210 RepID=UPI003465B551